MEKCVNLPKHVAIILDGNGRWAKAQGKARSAGHLAGLENLERIASYANKLGIEALTVYAFSTENWNRPEDEVDYLMKLPGFFLKQKLKKLLSSSVKINVLGRKDRAPKQTLKVLKELEDVTKEHTGLKLNICFDYGSKYEIKEALEQIVSKAKEDSNFEITQDTLGDYLYTRDLPDLDLLIRTSGEQRISNFMLYQLAYAELYFTDTYWPDFNEACFDKALESFANRKRRFGKI